jgi:U1 small nuclear ribonucleoprotein C
MSVRKAHNSGRNHLRNVVDYYQRSFTSRYVTAIPPANLHKLEIGHEKAQSVIDSITNSYAAEGQSSLNPMLNSNPGVQMPPFPPFPGGMHYFSWPYWPKL